MSEEKTFHHDNSIGPRIKALREQRELTVEQLSEQTTCSPEMIRALEAGELVPSLTPLIRLSRGLGVRLGTLLDDQAVDHPVVVRQGHTDEPTHFFGTDPARTRPSLAFHSLAPRKANRNMEPFIIDVHPADGAPALNDHEGEEFLYVLAGRLEVLYGTDRFELGVGDSIYYDSVVPHHVGALEQGTRILAVVYTADK